MSLSETIKSVNRYPGIKPFSEKEQYIFFGREKDLTALNSLIFIKQTVVLYSKSGYGKSSLINAGIIPRLKQNESWVYFSIRFNNYSERSNSQNLSPVETIRNRLAQDVAINKQNEFYSILPDENSFWYWIKLNQQSNNKSKFIIFFDQFEELFTYPKEQINEFSEQLSQLLYTTVPQKYRKRIAELDEENAVSNILHEFVYEKPEIKIVFSIRSDRMSLMNVLTDKHPSILQYHYELDALQSEDALIAITEPARLNQELGFKTPCFEYSPLALNIILKSIADPANGKIEAATLQIVCRYVEDTLVDEQKLTLITENNIGNITDIFEQYYQKILHRLPDNERRKAQHLIEDELIQADRRNPLTEGYIINKFGLSKNLLEQLEDSSLLRKERDASGRTLYEISHDTLIAAINKVAESRRIFEDQQQKKELEIEIEKERDRNEHLVALNKKAEVRFKLAISFALFAVIIAGIAFYYWQEAGKAVKVARKAEQEASSKRQEAQTALYRNYLLQAEVKINESQGYINTEEYGMALRSANNAKSLLNLNKDFNLSQNEQNERMKILKTIDDKIAFCEVKLHQ